MDTIENVILHFVPKLRSEPKYYDHTITIDDQSFLLNAINKARINDFTMRINPTLNGKELVIREIETIFTNRTEDQFIESSVTIAKHLHNIQKGNISDGFLIIIVGKADRNPAIAILKLEPVSGIIINWNGEEIQNLKVIKDLILNEKSSVYKFLYAQYKRGSNEYYLMDDQRYSSDYPVANFWLIDFANSELIEDERTRTLDAYLFLNKFSSLQEIPPEISLRLKNALNSKLVSSKPDFSIIDFKNEDVPKKYHSLFDDLANIEKPYDKRIRKDTSLIKRHLNKIIIDYENGAKLTYPYSEHNHSIKMKNNITHIMSKIIKINGLKK